MANKVENFAGNHEHFSSASHRCDNSIPWRKFAETADYLQNVQSMAASVRRIQLGHMSWSHTYGYVMCTEPALILDESKQIAQFSFALSLEEKRIRGTEGPIIRALMRLGCS